MIQIEIAGAGAGKTYGLAEKILVAGKQEISDNKKVFALTFTNAAKSKIINTILDIEGFVPDNIIIDTVHSFLLNEIIYPYSKFAVGDIYTKAVSIPLSSKIERKNAKKKMLKGKFIIHNEDVYQKAKIIVDKYNSKHSNKKKKEKVDFLISHIAAITQEIFLDEVQDLDSDAFRIFEILGINNIPIFMIGDPKQAIRYPKAFEEFIISCVKTNKEITRLLPINNISRRIPEDFLSQTNRFCPKDQIQTSSSNKKGYLFYLTSDNRDFHTLMTQFITNKDLIYIEEKEKNYHTHKEFHISFPMTLEEKLKKVRAFQHFDKELFIDAALNYLIDEVQSDSVINVLNKFSKKFKIELAPAEYAEMNDSLQTVILSKDGYIISSIDSVKGQEANRCIFVLNETTLKYFFQDNLEENNYHNKIWKKIYVALTRSTQELIFVIDKELLENQNIDKLKIRFEEMGILEFANNNSN